jgi:hypothetical protein
VKTSGGTDFSPRTPGYVAPQVPQVRDKPAASTNKMKAKIERDTKGEKESLDATVDRLISR